MDEGSPICLQDERCPQRERNAYGPAHLAPQPAPGLAFDARGVLAPIARESVADALLIVKSYGPWGADLNDAHRRQIVLADEVKRMTGTAEALQAEWDRECGDADTILHALGLDPANCRTDGGSLKVQMIVGALAHRDVMLKRDAEQPLRIAIARAVPAMHSYASKNPKHHFGETLQDPCGVHAWLAEFGA
jgi:hypothetical protein